jgi:tetratricopeptide (TPR) repeat protein
MSANPQQAGTQVAFSRKDWLILLGLSLACFAIYANAVSGDFVYDDTRQIVDNPLIKESRFYWKALTSDVWAFKGESEEAWSNYWRPTFTSWQILNYRLFGVDNTAGWHISNIFLHAIVTLLCFGFLRFLGSGRSLAAVIALVFAVHPAHVESVAWISGAPDLLMATGFIGSLWMALSAWLSRDARKHVPGLLLFALALGAKEVAIVMPLVLIVSAVFLDPDKSRPWTKKILGGIGVAIPYIVLAVIYFLVRLSILGQVSKPDATDVSLLSMALTAPELGSFYLRQSLFPVFLGPSYPLRTVNLGSTDLFNFWTPLLLVAFAAAVVLWSARNGRLQAIGAAVLVLLLLPAFNVDAFIPEHIVHDRYLYLPLLGILMVLVPTAARLDNLPRAESWPLRPLGYGIVGVWCALLAYQTIRYNSVWLDEVSLWKRGVTIDPSSEFNWTQYGFALASAGRQAEALEALDRSLESMAASSTPDALLKRAELNMEAGRLVAAVDDLNAVLRGQAENVIAYEKLAIAYQQAGRLEDAAQVLVLGREKVPRYNCEFSTNLAVVMYLGGAKIEALAELERVRPKALQSYSRGCLLALLRLGQLYAEFGRAEEGKVVLAEFLARTRSMTDQKTLRYREMAEDLLAR